MLGGCGSSGAQCLQAAVVGGGCVVPRVMRSCVGASAAGPGACKSFGLSSVVVTVFCCYFWSNPRRVCFWGCSGACGRYCSLCFLSLRLSFAPCHGGAAVVAQGGAARIGIQVSVGPSLGQGPCSFSDLRITDDLTAYCIENVQNISGPSTRCPCFAWS